MTTKTKKSVATDKDPNVTNLLIGFTEPVLKAISTLTATMMLQQPHFAGQANQQGLVELSNIMYQFMAGGITVQPVVMPNAPAPEGELKYA